MTDRLYRSREDRMIAGVAGGLAERLDIDPTIVRVIWAVLVLPTGFFALLVYLIMAIVVPDEDDLYRPTPWSAPPPGPMPGLTTPPAGTPIGGPVPLAPTGQAAPGAIPAGPASWPTDAAAPPGPTREEWRAQRRAERQARHGERRTGSVGLVIGVALVIIGGWLLLRQYLPELEPGRFWPVALIGLGILLLVLALARRGQPEGPR